MNSIELVEFKSAAARRLPNVGAWLMQNGETVGIWAEELWHDISLSDCLDVLRRLMSDAFDGAPWEMDRFGSMVRQRAKAIEYERETRNAERKNQKQVSTRGSMSKALSEIIKLSTRRQKAAALNKEFPDDDGPRYFCALCRDTGLLNVYLPETVLAAYHAKGNGSPFKVYVGVAGCACAAGNKFTYAQNPQQPARCFQYNAQRHIISNEITRSGRLEELTMAVDTWTPPNYHGEFDRYNRGEV